MNSIQATNPTDRMPIPAVRNTGRPADARAWKAAEDFTSVFMGQFVKAMRSGPRDTELFEECPGRDTFNEMFSEAIGRKMAADRSMGIQDGLYRQMGGKYVTDGASGAAGAGPARPVSGRGQPVE